MTRSELLKAIRIGKKEVFACVHLTQHDCSYVKVTKREATSIIKGWSKDDKTHFIAQVCDDSTVILG